MKPLRPAGRPGTSRAIGLAQPCAPDSIAAWIHRYLDALAARQITSMERRARKSQLAHFHAWTQERGIARPQDVTHAHVEAFQQHLFRYRKADGRPLAPSGQANILGAVNGWYRWLVKHRHVPSNPAADIDLPRVPVGLREPLNAREIEAVLALPDLATAQGLRDRALLEVFYATGLRRGELSALSVSDIDPERGTLHVRRGKGGKARLVPVGERALAWLGTYQRDARPAFVRHPHEPALFLNPAGERLSMNSLSWRIRRYLDAAGITKPGACHLFRHTMATAMLDNGADLRHVQVMLGHADIGTTQRYTHVSIAKLKAVHALTHPAAKLTRDGEHTPDDLD